MYVQSIFCVIICGAAARIAVGGLPIDHLYSKSGEPWNDCVCMFSTIAWSQPQFPSLVTGRLQARYMPASFIKIVILLLSIQRCKEDEKWDIQLNGFAAFRKFEWVIIKMLGKQQFYFYNCWVKKWKTFHCFVSWCLLSQKSKRKKGRNHFLWK